MCGTYIVKFSKKDVLQSYSVLLKLFLIFHIMQRLHISWLCRVFNSQFCREVWTFTIHSFHSAFLILYHKIYAKSSVNHILYILSYNFFKWLYFCLKFLLFFDRFLVGTIMLLRLLLPMVWKFKFCYFDWKSYMFSFKNSLRNKNFLTSIIMKRCNLWYIMLWEYLSMGYNSGVSQCLIRHSEYNFYW